jgi:hypothetical protein
MWKPEHRLAADCRGLRYPSDLTDAEWALVAPFRLFSIRPIGVKRFQAVSPAMGNVARGSALLFGIGRLALPAWDQGDGAEQSDSRPG